jgi:prefoldin subunit 2
MASQAQINPKKQQELQLQYTNFKNTLTQMAQKIGDIEQEAEEHKYSCLPIFKMLAIVTFIRLVIETLEPLPQDRKCFRMVNGVLVERTVKDVLPALKTNSDGLKQVLDELVKQYQSKQSELDDWKKKNNIQVVQP